MWIQFLLPSSMILFLPPPPSPPTYRIVVGRALGAYHVDAEAKEGGGRDHGFDGSLEDPAPALGRDDCVVDAMLLAFVGGFSVGAVALVDGADRISHRVIVAGDIIRCGGIIYSGAGERMMTKTKSGEMGGRVVGNNDGGKSSKRRK